MSLSLPIVRILENKTTNLCTIKNITCNLERNKIKYKQLNHIAITPILCGNPSKGKTTNNRSIINLDQTGQVLQSYAHSHAIQFSTPL